MKALEAQVVRMRKASREASVAARALVSPALWPTRARADISGRSRKRTCAKHLPRVPVVDSGSRTAARSASPKGPSERGRHLATLAGVKALAPACSLRYKPAQYR